MQIHADTTLIEAAQRIAPVTREHYDEAKRDAARHRRWWPPCTTLACCTCAPRGPWAG